MIIMEKLYNWVTLIGSTYSAVVSVISAFFIENLTIRKLLIISAVATLIIAVFGILNNRKISKKIKKLEKDKQDKLVFASDETCKAAADEIIFIGK